MTRLQLTQIASCFIVKHKPSCMAGSLARRTIGISTLFKPDRISTSKRASDR
jgi:hypothetical protein